MATVTETFKSFTSGISFSGIGGTVTLFAFLLLFTLIFGILFFLIIQHKKFNIKVRILQEVAGKGWVPVGSDRAMIVKKGDTGEEVLFLRKRKVDVPYSVLDINKLKKLINVNLTDIEDSIRKTFEWYKSRIDNKLEEPI